MDTSDPLAIPVERLRSTSTGWTSFGAEAPMRARFFWGDVVDVESTRRAQLAAGVRDGVAEALEVRPTSADGLPTDADMTRMLAALTRAAQTPSPPGPVLTRKMPMIEVGVAGGRSAVKRLATGEDARAYPAEWAAFQAQTRPAPVKPRLRLHVDGSVSTL